MIDYLGDVGHALNQADPAKLHDLYEALRLEITYDAPARAVDVTIRPTRRDSLRCPCRVARSGLKIGVVAR
jgi:hypothetical protein